LLLRDIEACFADLALGCCHGLVMLSPTSIDHSRLVMRWYAISRRNNIKSWSCLDHLQIL